MSIESLTARERQIYYCGLRDGKKEGNEMVAYLAIGFFILFGVVLYFILKK